MRRHSPLTVILGISAGFAIGRIPDVDPWRLALVAVVVSVFLRSFLKETARP